MHLASSDRCPYQAFRFGKTAYGTQFHPEVIREIVQVWSKDLGAERTELLNVFTEKEAEYRSASLTILRNFLRVAGVL